MCLQPTGRLHVDKSWFDDRKKGRSLRIEREKEVSLTPLGARGIDKLETTRTRAGTGLSHRCGRRLGSGKELATMGRRGKYRGLLSSLSLVESA